MQILFYQQNFQFSKESNNSSVLNQIQQDQQGATKILKSVQNDKQKDENQMTKKQYLQFFSRYVLPFKTNSKTVNRNIWTSYFLLIASKTCLFGVPLCLKYGVNAISSLATAKIAPLYFLAYGLLNIGLAFVDGHKAKVISRISLDAWDAMKMRLFDHLLKMDVDFHFHTSQKKRLFTLHQSQEYIEKNIRLFFNYFIPITMDFLIASTYMVFSCGPQFFLTYFLYSSIYSIYTAKISLKRKNEIKMQKISDRQADFQLSDALANIYTIKHYNREEFESQKFQTTLQKCIKYNLLNVASLWRLNAGQRIIMSLGMATNLLFAAQKVQSGLLTTGDIVLLQQLMLQLMQPLSNLGMMVREYVESFIDIRYLYKILNTQPAIKDAVNAKAYEYQGGEIKLDNVSFWYYSDSEQKKQYVLNKLNLTIPKQSFVTVIGESGIGKSTLFNLLFRFLDPKEGQILLDGQALPNLKLDSFRSKMAIASQNTYIFNDSILNNIKYANDKATLQQIHDLSRILNLHDFIMSLPEGYDTIIGEQGSKLSGGQKQRLSIMRCLLKDCPIILLDEVTSGLDQQNEMAFIDYLLKVKQTKTIIMITHRLNLNLFSDNVILLQKEGQFVMNDHQSLIIQNDQYREMWEAFVSKYQEAQLQQEGQLNNAVDPKQLR